MTQPNEAIAPLAGEWGKLHDRNPLFEYGGMSYEQASREAEKVIGIFGWYQGFERLAALREIMVRA